MNPAYGKHVGHQAPKPPITSSELPPPSFTSTPSPPAEPANAPLMKNSTSPCRTATATWFHCPRVTASVEEGVFSHAVWSNLDFAVQNPSEPDVCDPQHPLPAPSSGLHISRRPQPKLPYITSASARTSASGLIHASNVNSVNAAKVADSFLKVTCVSTPLKYMDAGPT